jgi:hypothetical protein
LKVCADQRCLQLPDRNVTSPVMSLPDRGGSGARRESDAKVIAADISHASDLDGVVRITG